ncbi:MAG: beta-lactamase family protein [Fimbriimonadaceae bacterium]|nr:beta-lactamase family protein [Fimbriimonadaceae bacterium]
MNRRRLFNHIFAVALGASLILGVCVANQSAAVKNYVEPFINALNAKDPAKLVDYLKENFGGSAPPDAMANRLKPLIENGAPFKFLKLGYTNRTLQRGLIEDKGGEQITLTLMLSRSNPPKIIGILLDGPESLDEPPAKDYTGWKDLQILVADIRKDTNSPAMAVCVWQDGKPMEVAVDGVRAMGKEEKVTPEEVWHIGSIGKSITSTLVAKLIEMGKLRWDMTLKEALPGVEMKPEYEGVKLFDIMRHRGGLPQDMGFNRAQVEKIVGTAKEPMAIRANYAKDVLSREPIGKPNEKFAYSNAGYMLLGHIAERTMNKPFEQLVKELVFVPLGMNSATCSNTLPDVHPSGHVMGQTGLRPYSLDGEIGAMMRPAGDMSSTVQDLAKFAKMHMDGINGVDGYLKSATIKKLHEAVPERPGDSGGYACGWSVGRLMGTAIRHGHNGSNGTFRAELAIFPKEKLIVAAIVNRGGETDPSPPLQAVEAIARRYAPDSK